MNTETQREEGHEDGCRDWQDAATSQAVPGATSSGRRQGKIVLWSLCRECGPADALMSGFWPPDCETIHFCCFQPLSLWYPMIAASCLSFPTPDPLAHLKDKLQYVEAPLPSLPILVPLHTPLCHYPTVGHVRVVQHSVLHCLRK